MKNREVSYAVLHNPIFVPKFGSIPPTLTADKDNKLRQVYMKIDETGMFLEVDLTPQTRVIVPLVGVSHFVLRPLKTTAEAAS